MTVASSILRTSALIAVAALGAVGCAAAPKAEWAKVKDVRVGASEATTADGYYADASAAIMARDYGRALDLLQLARRGRENDVRILNAFGVVYDKLGRFDLSARYYSLALTIDPASPVLKANFAYSQQLQLQRWGGQGDQETSPASSVPNRQPAPAGPSFRTASTPVMTAAAVAGPGPLGQPTRPQTPPTPRIEAPPVAKADAAQGKTDSASRPRTPWYDPDRFVQAQTRLPGGPPPYAVAFKSQPTPSARSGSPAAPSRAKPAKRTPSLMFVDASGHPSRVHGIKAGLSRLGWSAEGPVARTDAVLQRSIVRFPSSRMQLAQALARSLPGPVQLQNCGRACGGVQVLFVADVSRWRLQSTSKRS